MTLLVRAHPPETPVSGHRNPLERSRGSSDIGASRPAAAGDYGPASTVECARTTTKTT